MYTIGIDLGGTNIATAVVNENFKILGKGELPTNADRDALSIAKDMAKTVDMACEAAGVSKESIEWIGVGSPGAVNKKTGVIEYANNLHFSNVPLKQYIEELTGIKCYVENDANAAAYGELLAGAGRGYSDMVAITLGTGVGGGVIIDGKIFDGSNSFGAELGHTVIMVDGERCTCGRDGCWEAYASATALIRQTREAMEQHKDSLLWKLCGGDEAAVTARTAFDAARQGDPVGQALVDRYIAYLAAGLSTLIVLFRPQVILIGGGIGNEGEALLQPLRLQMAQSTYAAEEIGVPPVRSAALGNDAGIIGAAMLGRGQT